MNLRCSLRCLALAAGLVLMAGLMAGPAGAVEAPAGSKNFTPPPYAPDYFSNESGPFHSGANARAAAPPAVTNFAAPSSPRRTAVASHRYARHRVLRVAKARGRHPRRHVVHRMAGRRHIAHLRTARRGKAAVRRVAHNERRAAAPKGILAKARHRPAASRTRRVARAGG